MINPQIRLPGWGVIARRIDLQTQEIVIYGENSGGNLIPGVIFRFQLALLTQTHLHILVGKDIHQPVSQ
jgi:hypothetical protein